MMHQASCWWGKHTIQVGVVDRREAYITLGTYEEEPLKRVITQRFLFH